MNPGSKSCSLVRMFWYTGTAYHTAVDVAQRGNCSGVTNTTRFPFGHLAHANCGDASNEMNVGIWKPVTIAAKDHNDVGPKRCHLIQFERPTIATVRGFHSLRQFVNFAPGV
jgi:hypothetical protein